MGENELRNKFQFRINVKLRRRGQPAFETNRAEFKSEDYDDDRAFCDAVAEEMYEQLLLDREYQEGRDEDDATD